MRGKSKVFNRRLIVTEEPMFIHPGLIGKPLATPWRRAAAMVVDMIVVLLLVIVQVLTVNYIQNPSLVSDYLEYLGEEDASVRKEQGRRLVVEVVKLAHRRNTGIFPENIKEAIASGNDSLIAAALPESDFSILIELDSGGQSEYDAATDTMYIRNDIINGFGNWAAGAPAFMFYFTFVTWLLRGRTAGKALFRIRVVRLMGDRLSLWNSLGRTGGYAASAATFFIGFLEAFWHPNRQTVHDRIAGTVVIRVGRGSGAGDPDA
ncbi:MAG TPA: RDD family protein [Candidatus Krumholzibacterium sp.]|nr:RDD family protein [Candidatus Krumholzibacterium sp.]